MMIKIKIIITLLFSGKVFRGNKTYHHFYYLLINSIPKKNVKHFKKCREKRKKDDKERKKSKEIESE